ncbi:MAG TPA: hypothetical protein VFL83_02380 [Anaeromyxobacter sp.]|nr:hypothetical protein [Anaeromyxobacter sp.]
MTPGRSLPALVAALAVAAGCAPQRVHVPASGLPREAIPSTFAPLRWSVRPDDIPALFPNRELRQDSWSDAVRHVTWTVSDVRRIDGVAGALVADWIEGGDLWRVRLAFADPRRDCDPDLVERPRRCAEAGALAGVYDALQAELARGRGAPEATRAASGARTAAWRGTDVRLSLWMKLDARGAWSVEAVVTSALAAPGRDAAPR